MVRPPPRSSPTLGHTRRTASCIDEHPKVLSLLAAYGGPPMTTPGGAEWRRNDAPEAPSSPSQRLCSSVSVPEGRRPAGMPSEEGVRGVAHERIGASTVSSWPSDEPPAETSWDLSPPTDAEGRPRAHYPHRTSSPKRRGLDEDVRVVPVEAPRCPRASRRAEARHGGTRTSPCSSPSASRAPMRSLAEASDHHGRGVMDARRVLTCSIEQCP